MAIEALLLLSERFCWFPFNHHKGWAVLIALASVVAMLLLAFLWFVVALVFRWRFQFTIRSLLALMVAVAVSCSWLGTEMRKAKVQRTAVDALRRVGGTAQDDSYGTAPAPYWILHLLGDDFFTTVDLVDLSHTKATDSVLQSLEELPELCLLDLGGTHVTDAGLKHLRGLARLRFLKLSDTAITGTGLQYIEGLIQVECLYAERSKLTDAGLEHLAQLKKLETLDLSGTRITDAGLEHLGRLTVLVRLYLNDTRVTGSGLARLKGLPELSTVSLNNAYVTDAGLKSVKELAQCTSLCLANTKITDAGLHHFCGSNVNELNLSNTKITDAGLEPPSRIEDHIPDPYQHPRDPRGRQQGDACAGDRSCASGFWPRARLPFRALGLLPSRQRPVPRGRLRRSLARLE